MKMLGKIGWLVGATLLVSGVAFAVWPRGPRLEWYTSPLVTVNGSSFRAQVLVPVGWHRESQRRIEEDDGRHEVLDLEIGPSTSGSLLSHWFRSYSRSRQGIEDSLHLMLGDTTKYQDGSILVDEVGHVTGAPPVNRALRRLKVGSTKHTVVFLRNERSEFEATYRPICESFRVKE